tara:strand:+ start:145 stop:354 length:210 start_codon:yes stop_codon:yes gene_type:complete
LVQFQLSAFQKETKFKNIPNKLGIIFIERSSNDNTHDILRELKENSSSFFKASILKKISKDKKKSRRGI